MAEPGAQEYSSKEIINKQEKLSDEVFGNLLAAVGNSEAKAVTLLSMQEGKIYTRPDLFHAVIEAQGRRVGWKMSHTNPFQYCEFSFSPIGLVTKEVITPDLSTYGYIITTYGRGIGVPLAALLLDFSRKYQPSLNEIFGETYSKSAQTTLATTEGEEVTVKKRSPALRAKSYWELVTATLPIREVDLAERIDENIAVVGDHLRTLSKFGIIQYSSRESGQPFSYYVLSSNPPTEEAPFVEGRRALTSNMYNIYKEFKLNPGKPMSIEECVEHLKVLDPHLATLSARTIKTHAERILSHLRRHGYLDMERFDVTKQSEIDLTTDQRAMLLELVTLLDGIQNQRSGILQRGQELANWFSSHPEEVSSLMLKAKEHSPFANKTGMEQTKNSILGILTQNPGFDRSQIIATLETQYGKELSRGSVGNVLTLLSKEGKVLAVSTSSAGTIKRWYVTPHDK